MSGYWTAQKSACSCLLPPLLSLSSHFSVTSLTAPAFRQWMLISFQFHTAQMEKTRSCPTRPLRNLGSTSCATEIRAAQTPKSRSMWGMRAEGLRG